MKKGDCSQCQLATPSWPPQGRTTFYWFSFWVFHFSGKNVPFRTPHLSHLPCRFSCTNRTKVSFCLQFKMLQDLKGKPEGENLSDAEAFAMEISNIRKIDSRLQVRKSGRRTGTSMYTVKQNVSILILDSLS
jgi:hypothetical protein